MKIWIINHYAVPPDSPGGTRHYDLAQALAARGHEITIVASGYNHWNKQDRIQDGKAHQIEAFGPVRMVWVRTPPYRRNDRKRIWNMMVFFLNVLRLDIESKPDLIIGSSPHLLTPLAAWILAKRYRVPFVMEVRDLWPESLVRLKRTPALPILWLLRKLERFLYRKANLLISMVSEIDAYFRAEGIEAPSIVYVPNAAGIRDASALNPATEAALARLHAAGKFVMGYAGAHGPANDLENLIEAASRLKPEDRIQLVFVGDGPLKPDLEKKASGLPQVTFFPAISRREIPALLSRLDLLIFSVHPALESTLGSPNKLLDYMASGRPVLSTGKIPGDPVAKAGCGLSVPPQDPESLRRAMLEMSGYPPEELNRLGAKGKAYVLEHHDIDRLADRLLEALERITAGKT